MKQLPIVVHIQLIILCEVTINRTGQIKCLKIKGKGRVHALMFLDFSLEHMQEVLSFNYSKQKNVPMLIS